MTWILSFFAKFGGLKRYWQYILIALLVVIIGFFYVALLRSENRYLACKNENDAITAKLHEAQALADARQKSAEKIIEKEVVRYAERVKYIKEARVENSCESAFDFLRVNF